jgi:sulfate/thiosulfate transport system permease protein
MRFGSRSPSVPKVCAESRLVQVGLIALALMFLGVFLLLPVAVVLSAAFAEGLGRFADAVLEPMTLSAIRLSLLTAAIAVPLNTVFGVAAAWLIANYRFAGKGLLVTLIDLPFSVSPVVAGLVFVLLFGKHGWLGPLLEALDIRVIYAVPGIVLGTVFVTFPIVAREVLAVLQAQGNQEEQAALTLGANGWQIFLQVTLPKAKWGILYGSVLCNARAMGEFGAVSVISGHIRGETNTIPLQVDILYGEYDTQGAFSVASLLLLVAVFTLISKRWLEWRGLAKHRPSPTHHPASIPTPTPSRYPK